MSSFCYFKYCSLVFYLFLFEHTDKFEGLGLNRFSRRNAKPKSIFKWTPAVHQHLEGKGYAKFITDFMSISYAITHDSSPPSIFPEKKDWLQFSKTDYIGDWYLFEDHTKIRVYVGEVHP